MAGVEVVDAAVPEVVLAAPMEKEPLVERTSLMLLRQFRRINTKS